MLDAPLQAAPLPDVSNRTSYPSQYFQMLDVQGEPFHVVVSRVTYDMTRADAAGNLLLAETQTPLVESDEFAGPINASSVQQESDFAPFKPNCDLLFLHANACAPEGRPARRWSVGVRVGTWTKRLTVTGPRVMERTLSGAWRLDLPSLTTAVPIRYELAWGGRCRWPIEVSDGAEPDMDTYAFTNPLGRGFVDVQWLKRSRIADMDAPQIEPFDQPFTASAADVSNYPVAGLGAVARWWQPRVSKAGTYDEAWKRHRWPNLPLDFDFGYWNSAPHDQQIPYPVGGEDVMLVGLHELGDIQFSLPRPGLNLLLHLSAGVPAFKRMHTDTVIFDMRAQQVIMVQRAVVPAKAGVIGLEIGTWDFDSARRKNALHLSARGHSEA